MKAKVHDVTLFGRSYLVMARSKAGAIRDLYEYLREEIHADVATGKAIYEAGRTGAQIIGIEKYARQVDPDQLEIGDLDDGATVP